MRNRFIALIKLTLIFALWCSFWGCAQSSPGKKTSGIEVPIISSKEQYNALVDTTSGKLLMFDFYADWCMPCKILSPILEKISVDMKSSVAVFKINIDKSPEIASLFQVSGIPFVVLVKDKKVVQAFLGVQLESVYRRAITEHGGLRQESKDQPDGELINGVRVITLTTTTSIGNLYVYRGEEVRLVFERVDFPYSIHIPAMGVSGNATIGQNLTVEFKAKETGVFSIICNGKCSFGDGQQFAKLVVLEYDVENDKAIFKSISPKNANELIQSEKPFILDVRTPSEYFSERISGSVLIPLQQLADRIGELDAYKNKPILVYCRSGNRSIPASQILIRNNFKKVYNMKNGIVGWMKDGLPVER